MHDQAPTALQVRPAWSKLYAYPVAARLPNPDVRTREQPRAVEAAEVRASVKNFDLTRDYSRGHAEFCPDGQTLTDRIGDVRLRLGLGLPLTDTARDRRALGNIHAIFVLVDADGEFHAVLILTNWEALAAESVI